MGRIKIYLERGCDSDATEILGGVKDEGILMVQVSMDLHTAVQRLTVAPAANAANHGSAHRMCSGDDVSTHHFRHVIFAETCSGRARRPAEVCSQCVIRHR